MSRHRAFTLAELLAVIAILALLTAILTPALSRAREVVCRSHLQQWSLCSAMYTGDQDGPDRIKGL